MLASPMREPSRPPRSIALVAATLALLAGGLAGCASAPVSRPVAQAAGAAAVTAYDDVPVTAGLVYDEATGQALDVCSPVDAAPGAALPAVLVGVLGVAPKAVARAPLLSDERPPVPLSTP